MWIAASPPFTPPSWAPCAAVCRCGALFGVQGHDPDGTCFVVILVDHSVVDFQVTLAGALCRRAQAFIKLHETTTCWRRGTWKLHKYSLCKAFEAEGLQKLACWRRKGELLLDPGNGTACSLITRKDAHSRDTISRTSEAHTPLIPFLFIRAAGKSVA